ncbi:MAG: right-handed parallel beta-helix repeat-containing protein [Candidatus Omnitrophota bacterium]
MRIKTSKTRSPLIDYLKDISGRNKRRISVLLAVFYSIFLFVAGVLVHKSGLVEDVIKPAIKSRRVFLKHLARGAFKARPERLTIDIKHEDFQKLEYKRREALEANLLMKDDADYVNARIRHNGKTLKAKMRLKGDHTDHLVTDKWSFRVVLKGDDTLFGMKVFSLQHPNTRNYIYEWLFHKALRREGLVSLRYDFIDVTVNGRDLGIYAIEEFFDKRIIEHNEYREGPIIRFDEEKMWEERLQRGDAVNAGSYLSSTIDAFQTNKTMRDEGLRNDFLKALSLLELFRKGELKTSDVFDAVKLAKFFALCDLMGAEHATIWINMRFYFNPITCRLEPIGFDASCAPIQYPCLKQQGDSSYAPKDSGAPLETLYSNLTRDREFLKLYMAELERVSDPSYIENLFSDIGGELKSRLDILYKGFPYYNFSKDMYYSNRQIIEVSLNPVKVVNAYFNGSYTEGLDIEFGNAQAMDAEVVGLLCDGSVMMAPAQEVFLSGKIPSETVAYRNTRFLFPAGFEWDESMLSGLKLVCRVFGTSRERHEAVFPFNRITRSFIDNDFVRERPNSEDFDFISVDESDKKILIKQGLWEINRNLILPEGYTVICAEGVQINLTNKAKILSFSPLYFIGSEELPITVYSGDSTGEAFLVMAQGRKSVLKYVIFKNLAAPEQAGWKLTGAVTFYESPVEIYNCEFLGNRMSDDGLNVVRSGCLIERTLFKDTFSDALDFDFVKGRIIDTSFINCGNDGIDVSGSVVDIERVLVDGAKDKGISAGEISSVTAEDVRIRNSNIAGASKDLSVLNITNMNITDCDIGFTVYKKKAEYGGARLIADNCAEKGIKKRYMLEDGSGLLINKAEMKPNAKDVYVSLYGTEE